MRLGVGGALVDGTVVPGDVSIDRRTGVVAEVGLSSPGRGTAVPGLVDLQVNGVEHVDLRSCGPAGYREAAEILAASGATAVQPTLHSQPLDAYLEGLATLGGVHRDPPPGCRFLAAHLEGPFLSPEWAGAHDPAHLLTPDPAVLDRLLAAGPVGFVTLAPELDGAAALVDTLVARGVVVSLGHTAATAAQVRAAVDAGARHLTHCWNAQRRLTARDPGPAAAALLDDRVVIGLIADLAHVVAEVVELTLRLAPGRVAVTTDLIAGAPSDSAADGDRLAGGFARPDQCLRNLVDLGCALADAVDACGGVQRRLLGLPDIRLRPGDVADLVVLDDSLHPTRTLVDGVEVHVT